MTEAQAQTLVTTDSNDRQKGGQRTQEAFHLSDVFLDVARDGDDWKRQLGRFLDVLFSHPYKTPTRDEQAMFMAYSASLRSAQFGRQVGAAITSAQGDILSIGCNEVPKQEVVNTGIVIPGTNEITSRVMILTMPVRTKSLMRS